MKKAIGTTSILLLLVLILLNPINNAITLEEIRSIASSPVSGDALLIWLPGGFWAPPYQDEHEVTRQECTWPGLMVIRDDGTTLWIESNFWNIVSGEGENYLRFINTTDEIAFYGKLNNVTTMWGGIAWATPSAVIVGRAPPQFATLPSVGGYGWFSLPMKVTDFLKDYEELYVKGSYEVAKSEGTLVRWGLLMWFEDLAGMAKAEVYIAFHDDFGGWVGDRTIVKTMAVPMIVDGEVFIGEFEVQRALSGGGWAAMVFLLKNASFLNNTIFIDIYPFIEEVYTQMVEFYGFPGDQLIWSDIVLGSYLGSEGTGFELGWIIHDARLIPPELSPKIIEITVTEIQTTTKTVIDLKYETITQTQISTATKIETTSATVTVTDITTTAGVGIVLLVIGFLVGWFIKKK